MKNWYACSEEEINIIKKEYSEGEKLKDIMNNHDLVSMQDILILCVRDRRNGWNYCPYCGQKVEGSDTNDKRLYCSPIHSRYMTRERNKNKYSSATSKTVYKDDPPRTFSYIDPYSKDRIDIIVPGLSASFKRFIDEATAASANGMSYGYAKISEVEHEAHKKRISYAEEVDRIRYKLDNERREHAKGEFYYGMTGEDIDKLEEEEY